VGFVAPVLALWLVPVANIAVLAGLLRLDWSPQAV